MKLSTAADGGFAGSTGGIPFASAASGADGIGEHDATSTAGAAGAGVGAGAEASGTEERVPSGLDLLLDSDEANTSAATTALEAIAPWASVPYEEQCRRKHKACFKATVKFVRSCKQLWTKKNRTAYFVESKRRRAEGLPKPESVNKYKQTFKPKKPTHPNPSGISTFQRMRACNNSRAGGCCLTMHAIAAVSGRPPATLLFYADVHLAFMMTSSPFQFH